jgi:UDP-2,3-diacylglucosamine hydrolase
MSKHIVISDAHLGAQSLEMERCKTENLSAFLHYVAQQQAHLIICGDLFDFWFEYRHAIPRLHFRILCQLAGLVADGHRIDYVAGNHDFWIGSFLEKEVGMVLHLDDYELQDGSKKIYVTHGDGLLKKDVMYRLLKRILRNRFNVFLYQLLHPDIGVPLAHFFSSLSRNVSQNRLRDYDIDYRQFAYRKIDQGFDVVVMGHSHWSALEPYGTGFYMNCGHWMDPFTFCTIEEGKPAIQRWNGSSVQPFSPELPPGNARHFTRS